MNYLWIYKRGTRLGRVAQNLGIPVAFQNPNDKNDWFYARKGRTALLAQHVNWGSRGCPSGAVNGSIANAVSKLKAFQLFSKNEIPHPRYSESFVELTQALKADKTIFARQDGLSGGRGIVVIKPHERPSSAGSKADFFVERISHQREFRCHVWGDKVIVVQAKMIAPGNTNPIHSYENGAKFTTAELNRFLPEARQVELCNLAIKAVSVLGLFFGAVDIIQSRRGKFYVLEVNTAPGIRSDPVEYAYQEALKGLIIGHGKES